MTVFDVRRVFQKLESIAISVSHAPCLSLLSVCLVLSVCLCRELCLPVFRLSLSDCLCLCLSVNKGCVLKEIPVRTVGGLRLPNCLNHWLLGFL
jgi:hypothetical protein